MWSDPIMIISTNALLPLYYTNNVLVSTTVICFYCNVLIYIVILKYGMVIMYIKLNNIKWDCYNVHKNISTHRFIIKNKP